MRYLLAVIITLLVGTTSAADWPSAEDYVAWADCDNDTCRYSRQTWAEEYRNATAGQYQGQRNVSFCLSTGCDGAIKVNKILGCAWRFVIVESGHLSADVTDTSNLKYYCGPEQVDEAGYATAEAQARTLLKMLGK